MLDLDKLEKQLDEALEKETIQSLKQWLNSKKPKQVTFNRKGTLNILNCHKRGLILSINENGDKTPFTYYVRHKRTYENI